MLYAYDAIKTPGFNIDIILKNIKPTDDAMSNNVFVQVCPDREQAPKPHYSKPISSHINSDERHKAPHF